MVRHTSTVVAVPSQADTQLSPMGVAWSTNALIACSLRIRSTPRTLGPFEKGLRMKPFLRWGRTRGPGPRYANRIRPISAGMGEVYPPRAFPSDGPVPLRRAGVRAPPSGPATGKPTTLRKPRFRPTRFNTPTLCVLCASDLPTDDFAPYARRKLGWAGLCTVRSANSTHAAHRRALSVRMALTSIVHRG